MEMEYRVTENYYGPDIRFNDWRVEEGKTVSAGGVLHLLGGEQAIAVRSDYLYGGGGDVELRLSLNFDRLGQGGSFTAHFNHSPKDESHGFRAVLDADKVTVHLRNELVGQVASAGCGPTCEHEFSLVTLGESYAVHYNGECVAQGDLAPPFTDNEGTVKLSAERADVRLLSFQENFIAHNVEIPPWQRGELLYQESFGAASFGRNWICNHSGSGAGPEFADRSFLFRMMCNCLLRERFAGPIAVDYVARPVPTDRFCAGITDAIFIWMLDRPEGDLFGYLESKTEAGEAGLNILLPIPLYWVDLGGSNNVTTRLRKNPGRHMVRQFTDRPRLLERDRTYAVTVVANGHFIEFWVDGQPMVQFYDPHPLTAGHVGVRAFCADLEISGLKVWSLAPRMGGQRR